MIGCFGAELRLSSCGNAVNEAKASFSSSSVAVRANFTRTANRKDYAVLPPSPTLLDCLTKAGRQKTYADCVLYSTLMPCYRCTGAAVQFGVPKVIVGESVNFPGGEAKWGKSPAFMRANGIEVIDLHDAECIEMMKTFVKEHPELWNEDIGK